MTNPTPLPTITPRFDEHASHASIGSDDDTVSSIRKRNLMWLRTKFQEDQQRKFPDEPDLGMDKAFAERIGLNPKYFGHIKNNRRNVGNALAREVEAQFSLPIGWMDAPHADTLGSTPAEEEVVGAVLALFRERPDDARRVLMRALADTMSKKLSS